MPSWCLLTPASTCLTPRTVRSRPRPVRKVWSGLEELLSGLGLEIPRHRGGPWLCRWTSTSKPVELSSLDLCQQPSCSHRQKLCDPATTTNRSPLICEKVSCPHPSSSSSQISTRCLSPPITAKIFSTSVELSSKSIV